MNLVFTGFMGVGKTSVGRRLAQKLRWPFLDTDALIEEACSMTIDKIFRKCGESSFRETEKAMVERVARRRRCVIATGGGVILDRENVERLRRDGLLIHLTLSLEIIYHRIGHQSGRPLIGRENSRQSLENLFQSRERFYRAYSDFTVDRTGHSVEQTVKEVLEGLHSYRILGNSAGRLIRRG